MKFPEDFKRKFRKELHDLRVAEGQGRLARLHGLPNHPCPEDPELKKAWKKGFRRNPRRVKYV